MKTIIFTATLVAITTLYSCNSTKKVANPPIPVTENTMDITVGASQQLYNKKWLLQTLQGNTIRSKAFVQFYAGNETRIAGNTGCNSFSAAFSFKSFNTIAIGPLVTTKMACLQTDIIEPQFLKMLESTNTWAVENNILTLYNNEMVLGTFMASTPN